MKFFKVAIATLVVGLLQISSVQAFEIREVNSPGGLNAWLVSDKTVPLITVRFSFRGGSVNDPQNARGRSHFLSGMLDEGAGDLKSQEFQQRMSELAMRMSFSSNREHFGGSFQTLSENKDAAFELLRLAVTQPRFDAEPMEKVRGQILLGINGDKENPGRIARNALLKTMLGDHPYARVPTGDADSITVMKPEDLRNAWSEIFVRNQLLISVVGDITADELGPLLDKVFGALPEKGQQMSVPDVKAPAKGSITIVERKIPQSVMSFAMPGMQRSDPDFIPAYVMNFVLGDGGFGSRLMEEVREKRGLTYGIYTGLASWMNGGLLIGSVSTQNSKAGETLDVLRAELVKMAEKGPTEEELDQAKTYLTGSYALRFDRGSKTARQLLGIQQDNLGIDYVKKRNDLIRAVTVEDAKRVARRLIDPEALTISIVGRPEGIPLKTNGAPG